MNARAHKRAELQMGLETSGNRSTHHRGLNLTALHRLHAWRPFFGYLVPTTTRMNIRRHQTGRSPVSIAWASHCFIAWMIHIGNRSL